MLERLKLRPLSEVTTLCGRLWWWLWTSSIVTLGLSALLWLLAPLRSFIGADPRPTPDLWFYLDLVRGLAPVFFGVMGAAVLFVALFKRRWPARWPDDRNQPPP